MSIWYSYNLHITCIHILFPKYPSGHNLGSLEKLTNNVGRGPYLSCLVDDNHLEGSMDCRLKYISSSDKIICNREIFKKCTYQGDYRRLNHWQLSQKRWCSQTWCLTQRSPKSQCDSPATSKCPKKIPTTKSDYALSDFLQRFAWISHKMPQTLAEGFEIVDSNAPSPRTGMVGIRQILGR